MNQVIATVAISYGTSYLIKYAVNCFTDAIFNRTTKIVKNKAKTAWDHITNNEVDKGPVEYELIDLGKDDVVVYVTSKKRKDSIDENWEGLCTPSPTCFENTVEKNSEIILKDTKEEIIKTFEDFEKNTNILSRSQILNNNTIKESKSEPYLNKIMEL